MNNLQLAKYEMVEAGGRTAATFGLSRLLGQIYMLLYVNGGELSLDEMVAQLEVSKASISIACRQLDGWGAIRKVWVKGDRKDYYRAVTEIRALLNNGILPEILKKLDSAKVQIDLCRELLDQSEGSLKEAEQFKARLDEAERYREKISNLLQNPIVKKLL